VFLAGRDSDEILRDDVQAPGVALLHLMRVSVDPEKGVVRAAFLGFIGHGLAIERPGVGCTTVPDGDLTFAKNASPSAAGFGAPASPSRDAAAAASPANARAPWHDGEAASPLSAPLTQVLAEDTLVGPGMRAVLVIDHGKLVAERYGAGFSAQTPLLGWSLSKTVIAGLIGMLVKDGKLTLDQSGFWAAGDGRERIKLSDLLAMSSGLHFNEAYGAVSDVTAMLYLRPDMAAFAHDQPLDHPPGEVWSYSSGTAVLLSRILQDAVGMTSATMEADEHGTLVGSSYMFATAHDRARYGQFLAKDGVWKDARLLPEGYVAMMATPIKAAGGQYGMGQTWLWGSDAARPGRRAALSRIPRAARRGRSAAA
jgi:CubicO group peptidase (beta-lactamase class C family)